MDPTNPLLWIFSACAGALLGVLPAGVWALVVTVRDNRKAQANKGKQNTTDESVYEEYNVSAWPNPFAPYEDR